MAMKEKNWILNSNKVRAWLETQEDSPITQAIGLSLQLGDLATDDDGRSQYWTAVRAMGKSQPNFPAPNRGQPNKYTDSQNASMDSVIVNLGVAFASIPTEYHDMLLAVMIPHGRTGGVYADYDALVADIKKKAMSVMTTALKDGRWDGEMNGNVPQITPTATKTEVDSEEE